MNDVNKACSCPSGEGSLRHPCPAHPSLADVQPGGRVTLGDGVRCSKCKDRGYFDVDVDVDDSGGSIGNIEACPHCTLSAQPSLGGQDARELLAAEFDKNEVTAAAARRLRNHNETVVEAAALRVIAARQPARIYGCCAQPEGELHTAECPNMRHVAARRPVNGLSWADYWMECGQSDVAHDFDAFSRAEAWALQRFPGARQPVGQVTDAEIDGQAVDK